MQPTGLGSYTIAGPPQRSRLYVEATQPTCCRMPMHMATLYCSIYGFKDKSHAMKNNRVAPEAAVPLQAP